MLSKKPQKLNGLQGEDCEGRILNEKKKFERRMAEKRGGELKKEPQKKEKNLEKRRLKN